MNSNNTSLGISLRTAIFTISACAVFVITLGTTIGAIVCSTALLVAAQALTIPSAGSTLVLLVKSQQ